MGMTKGKNLDIEKIFSAMDIDGNGTVTYNEFLAASIRDVDDSVLQKSFMYIDQSNKNYITPQDLADALKRNGRIIKVETLTQMF